MIVWMAIWMLLSSAAMASKSLIQVRGLSHIEPSTFWHYFGDREKTVAPLRHQAYWDKKIQVLYHSGFFNDIAVYHASSAWTVVVKERSMIKEIKFEGFKDIDEKVLSALKRRYQLKQSVLFSEARAHQFCQSVQQDYHEKSYFNAQCVLHKQVLSDHEVALSFKMTGIKTQVTIDQIRIEGNHEFSKHQLLKSWPISQTSIWSFFSNKNTISTPSTTIVGERSPIPSSHNRQKLKLELEASEGKENKPVRRRRTRIRDAMHEYVASDISSENSSTHNNTNDGEHEGGKTTVDERKVEYNDDCEEEDNSELQTSKPMWRSDMKDSELSNDEDSENETCGCHGTRECKPHPDLNPRAARSRWRTSH